MISTMNIIVRYAVKALVAQKHICLTNASAGEVMFFLAHINLVDDHV